MKSLPIRSAAFFLCLFVSTSALAQGPIPDPYLYFDFEDGTDPVLTDGSGNGFDGAVGANVTFTVGAPSGSTPLKAGRFQGGIVNVPGINVPTDIRDNPTSNNGSYTLACWLKPDAASIGGDHFLWGQTSQGIHNGLRGNGTLHTAHWGSDFNASTILTADEWIHATWTYDGTSNTANIYLDGALDGGPFTQNAPNGSGNLILGGRDGGLAHFLGDVDDVAVWREVLSLTNIQELAAGESPIGVTQTDDDNDGMPDAWETLHSLDDPNGNEDGDALTNLEEYNHGTDPNLTDTDNDGLSDSDELNVHGTNPLIQDMDNDGLTDGEEITAGTSPTDDDSDNDGYLDGYEVAAGSNPLSAASVPPRTRLLHYTLDIQNGTTVENRGTLVTDGTLTGGATYGAGPDTGYGTAFVGNRTGVNDARIDTNFTAAELGLNGDNWTAMAWVYWDGVSGGSDQMIFGMNTTGTHLHLGIRDGAPNNIHHGLWSSDIGDAGTVPEGVWTHVTFSRTPENGGSSSVHVNGLLSAYQTKAANLSWQSDQVAIGFSGRAGHGSFNGVIDEVKIFDRFLSVSEIQEEMGPTSLINSYAATPTLSFPGAPVTLGWDASTSVTSMSINQGVGNIHPQYTGNTVVNPAVTTDYDLTIGLPAGGTETKTVTVTVTTSPIIDAFTASPHTIEPGGMSNLSWSVRNTVSLDLNGTDVTGSSGTLVSPSDTTTYTLTATNGSGTSVEQKTVSVVIPGEPAITEFQASNNTTLIDEDGDASDWIQISNRTSSPSLFNDYYLTDDPDVLIKWKIPFLVLEPGESFLVFASGKDRDTAGSELHSNFLLSASGEYLALVKVSGGVTTILSEFNDYPKQFEDLSYGLSSDGVSDGYFAVPTPTSVNGTALADYVRDTSFSVDRGFYDTPFNVAITSNTAGASFRYTTDGSPPSEIAGTFYTGPISISTTTNLRVIGYKADHISTDVDTQTYIFLDDVLQQSTNPSGFPSDWNGHPADYEMDPDVVNNPSYSGTIKNDLKTIPSISIVTRVEDMFGPSGVYSHPTSSGSAWERAASMEFIHPDNSPGHQSNCAVRMQGGVGRNTQFEKHSFRLLFKRGYGPTKLEYPIFENAVFDGENAAERFDTITLRSQFNNSWHRHNTAEETRAQFLRDQFMHNSQLAMGHASPHGIFVHLYVNGLYWGLYNVVERPNADFASHYYGGKKDEWDALNSYPRNVVDGNASAWVTAHTIANAGVADQAGYDALSEYVDIPNLIDYMIVNFYGGNQDWDDHNWYSARHRVPGAGYKFFCWDAERSLESTTGHNKTGVGQADKPSRLYSQLRSNPEFRMQFADHAHRACFNDGPLTPAKSIARYQALSAYIDRAIVGESARWGDSSRATPYTRDAEWVTERDRLLNDYLPARTNVFLGFLRSANLYPNVDAPVFSQHGGRIASTTELVMSSTGGQIYYTLDGSDPRLPGDGINATALTTAPLFLPSNVTVKARVLDSGNWSALNEASYVVDAVAASSLNLVVTELDYRPLPPTELEIENGLLERSEFEFLELMNVGSTSIDLTNVHFDDGVTFAFNDATNGILLGAGERVILVNNLAGFTSRHPSVPASLIAGEFSGSLSNDGETVTLRDENNAVIQSFTYNDQSPWPTEPDGDGFTLVLKNPQSLPDHNVESNWRASAYMSGSAGSSDATTFIGNPTDDNDSDGYSALAEYGLGGSDSTPDDRSLPDAGIGSFDRGMGAEDYFTITFLQNLAADDVVIEAEISDDHQSWAKGPGNVEFVGSTHNGDGTATVVYRSAIPFSTKRRQFLRVSVTLQ